MLLASTFWPSITNFGNRGPPDKPVLGLLGQNFGDFGNDNGPLPVPCVTRSILPNFAHIPGSFLLLFCLHQARKSFSFNARLPMRRPIYMPPAPSPYVDPIRPKVTQYDPRFLRVFLAKS